MVPLTCYDIWKQAIELEGMVKIVKRRAKQNTRKMQGGDIEVVYRAINAAMEDIQFASDRIDEARKRGQKVKISKKETPKIEGE